MLFAPVDPEEAEAESSEIQGPRYSSIYIHGQLNP